MSLKRSLSQRKNRPVTMTVATVVIEPSATCENWPEVLTKWPGQYQQQRANQNEEENSTDCSPSVANPGTIRHPQLPGGSKRDAYDTLPLATQFQYRPLPSLAVSRTNPSGYPAPPPPYRGSPILRARVPALKGTPEDTIFEWIRVAMRRMRNYSGNFVSRA